VPAVTLADVMTRAGPAAVDLPEWVQWVAALGPGATLLGATVAAAIAVAALVQRRKADAKSEWWRRAQWALDQVLAEDHDRQAIGASVMLVLFESRLAEDEDLDLFQAAWQALLDDVEDADRYEFSDGET
jgi:hypothetical protein